METVMKAVGALVPFDLGKRSEFQNSVEMLALVIGILVAVTMGAVNSCIKIRGDSITVLEWAKRGTFRASNRSTSICMALVVILEKFNITINEESQHLSSKANHVCDDLSRGREPALNSCGEGVVWCKKEGMVSRLVELCNPLSGPQDETAFITKWKALGNVIKANDML